MIVIMMVHHGMTLQEAVDYVGDRCRETIDAFIECTKHVPKWGGKIGKDVEKYVQGLQDWIVGYVFSGFFSELYSKLSIQITPLEFYDNPVLW